MIVTIDGPAGAGKSSISKIVAQRLNIEVLDTGAMYRSFAYIMKKNNLSFEDATFHKLLNDFTISFQNGRIIANKEDITEFIRTPEMDIYTSKIVSVHPLVREKMYQLQRSLAHNTHVVAEGRDMGSNVFPHADIKIYLDASVEVRAKRRLLELQERGVEKSLDDLKKEIALRDHEDMNRSISPLVLPKDGLVIDTSHMLKEQVIDRIIELVEDKKKENLF
ncbi:MAG: (d)CMP kinase [Brevinema sp.]